MRVPLTDRDLWVHLNEQISFLYNSSRAYDDGQWWEAKRLAVTVRILVHEPERPTAGGRPSRPLLAQMGKANIPFCNSTWPYDPENLAPHMGLVAIEHSPAGVRFIPVRDLSPKNTMSFSAWWHQVVFATQDRSVRIRRRDLVLALANEDGGAHVDPELKIAYAKLKQFNALGWKTIDQLGNETDLQGAGYAAMRQIAYEVWISLADAFPECFVERTDSP